MNIGDEINDCYMLGIGNYENMANKGRVEAIGIDWVIVRDLSRHEPIFVNKSITELEQFLS